MERERAERITGEYMKQVYGFALKRCATDEDAEDLTQEICLKLYRTLSLRDDIEDVRKFVWTIAHNALANYYRGKQKSGIGVCVDDLAYVLASNDDVYENAVKNESESRLHREIAYLSKLRRRIIIAYYYENKKQDKIAIELGIPPGTVKWHLFEAKKDLKKGLNAMRQTSELKFNPIKFEFCGTNGSPGAKGANNNFFRSALSQNIAYSVWKEAKSVNEIADELGVSPVYVESEAEYLADYGFLIESKSKYLCNILLDEATEERILLHDKVYQNAAKVFANELYAELTSSGILKDKRIICAQTDKEILPAESEEHDDNFILWSLIPYIAALSGESLMDKSISFANAATLRPDGGYNICHASITAPNVKRPMYFESMKHWCGPCWNANKDYTLWQIDSEWSEGRVYDGYISKANRVLSLFSREQNDVLTKEEYTFLAEMGMIKTNGDYDGLFKSSWQIVFLKNMDIKRELINIGDRIKEKHWSEFEAMKAPFIKAILDSTPKHLQKMQKYELQYIFFSDGWFILHCLKELVNNGKLKLPTEEQKKSLTSVIMAN